MGQLLEAIADPTNLARAWARVRANAGAAGIDGQSVYAFDADAEHSSRRCVRGCSRPSVTSLRRCGGWTFPNPMGEPARSGSLPSLTGWSNRPPGR